MICYSDISSFLPYHRAKRCAARLAARITHWHNRFCDHIGILLLCVEFSNLPSQVTTDGVDLLATQFNPAQQEIMHKREAYRV